MSVAEIAALAPQAIVLSPGPCAPESAGISLEVVRQFGPCLPILGVCLGHQAIAQALGGRVVRAPQPVHGQASTLTHDGTDLFQGLSNPLRAGRYHSLIVEESSLPEELEVTCRTSDGLVMALQHRKWPTFGVQFHPESILTDGGHRLLANFLRLAGLPSPEIPPGERPARDPADDFYRREIEHTVPPLSK